MDSLPTTGFEWSLAKRRAYAQLPGVDIVSLSPVLLRCVLSVHRNLWYHASRSPLHPPATSFPRKDLTQAYRRKKPKREHNTLLRVLLAACCFLVATTVVDLVWVNQFDTLFVICVLELVLWAAFSCALLNSPLLFDLLNAAGFAIVAVRQDQHTLRPRYLARPSPSPPARSHPHSITL